VGLPAPTPEDEQEISSRRDWVVECPICDHDVSEEHQKVICP
jgi:hypothetical protein